MDEKSLELLEFHQVRKILAGFTSFSASAEMALNLLPLSSFQQVSLSLRQSAEARKLLSLELGFSIGGAHDIRQAVHMAAREKALEPQTLLEIKDTLAAARELRGSLNKRADELPLLWNIAGSIVELPKLEKHIGSCLAPTGDVLDSASPKLAGVRQGLRETRQKLLDRLEAIMRSPRGRKVVQDHFVAERGGRLVIPLKLEFRKEIKGIVHDISNTGATAFVEPWSTIDLGNELRELALEERQEVERVLRELSAEIGSQEAEICDTIALVAELDLALAKARYAYRAGAAEPNLAEFGDEKRTTTGTLPTVLRLSEARHPLLAEKAVPLSVEIGQDFSVLVITGPNTGGKTVALKTIGLLSLMAQAGMPVPASGDSCIPVFDSVFADIGDEQSIERTLSTFSWHMGNISRIVNSATGKSLVLLDELGTSTDPEEGSALARAILLHFLSRSTMTVATTHYNDLKVFAHITPGMKNASLLFDPVTSRPTYHLTLGIPGGSHALATASRLGLDPDIIASARALVSSGTRDLETVLADLRLEQQKAEDLRLELAKEKTRVERQSKELENEMQRLAREERKILQETRDRVLDDAAALRREIRQAESDLRREKTRERIEQAEKAVAAVRKSLESEAWQAKTQPETGGQAVNEGAISPGDTVWLKEANMQATVLSVLEDTRQIEVQAGQYRLRLNLDGVQKLAQAGATSAPRSAPIIRKPAEAVSPELDLRGRRAEEIEPALDKYLNGASLANLREARIIHGFATGTVRRIVREFLASHSLVRSFRPGQKGEGGDGVTVVYL